MWQPTNLVEAMLPIYLINSIFCHGVIQYPRIDKSKVYYSFVYSITTTIIFCMCLIFVCLKSFDRFLSNHGKASYYINTAIIILVMIINIIVSWIHKNKSLKVDLKIISADETLNKLGVPVNAQREFFFTTTMVFLWIFYALFLDISYMIATEKNIDVSQKIIPTFTLQHGYHVNVLIDMIFCLLIKHMRLRFKSINKVLLDIFKLQDTDLMHKKKTNYKWAISRRVNFEKDFLKIIHDVKRIHLELGILCRELTRIYGIPIVFSMLTAYINIHGIILIFYKVAVNPQNSKFDKVMVLASLFLWFMIFTSRIISINYICAESVFEWKKTGEIIHKLELESEDMKFQTEIKQFSIQILQNPLTFSPCGLFDLGYYFLREFAAALTAQVILSIQTYRFTSK